MGQSSQTPSAMPPPKRKRRLSSVRDLLKGRAYTLLGLLSIRSTRVIRVRARNKTQTLTIVLAPAGTETSDTMPGRHLSPCEQLIVLRIRELRLAAPQEKVTQSLVSGRTGLPLDTAFKTIIRNLVDRQILTHDGDNGYDLATGV